MTVTHLPVMVQEVSKGLAIKANGTYVDLTIGRGGHSRMILQHIPQGRLLGFDQDAEAIQALESLARDYDQLTLHHENFQNFPAVLASLGINQVDGILLDLGVSSPQFDVAERGFSYRLDGPLDMRMDQRQSQTAQSILATADVTTLTKIFRDYGDETFAYPIAKAIVKQRERKPLETTFELVALIKAVKPKKALLKKGHPAKQVFQALRIAVNDELEALKKTLHKAKDYLKEDGRLAVISFHSGEDRIVKQYFHQLTVHEGSRHQPLALHDIPTLHFAKVPPYPALPSQEEISNNHRAESAVLRVIRRLPYAQ